jgi:hypothetical protein
MLPPPPALSWWRRPRRPLRRNSDRGRLLRQQDRGVLGAAAAAAAAASVRAAAAGRRAQCRWPTGPRACAGQTRRCLRHWPWTGPVTAADRSWRRPGPGPSRQFPGATDTRDSLGMNLPPPYPPHPLPRTPGPGIRNPEPGILGRLGSRNMCTLEENSIITVHSCLNRRMASSN